MAKNEERAQDRLFGDLTPDPGTQDHLPSRSDDDAVGGNEEDEQSMFGGSQHDRTRHSGSRDVTEGVTGGTGTETGGVRNMRQGTGHTGGDIGNRPE